MRSALQPLLPLKSMAGPKYITIHCYWTRWDSKLPHLRACNSNTTWATTDYYEGHNAFSTKYPDLVLPFFEKKKLTTVFTRILLVFDTALHWRLLLSRAAGGNAEPVSFCPLVSNASVHPISIYVKNLKKMCQMYLKLAEEP